MSVCKFDFLLEMDPSFVRLELIRVGLGFWPTQISPNSNLKTRLPEFFYIFRKKVPILPFRKNVLILQGCFFKQDFFLQLYWIFGHSDITRLEFLKLEFVPTRIFRACSISTVLFVLLRDGNELGVERRSYFSWAKAWFEPRGVEPELFLNRAYFLKILKKCSKFSYFSPYAKKSKFVIILLFVFVKFIKFISNIFAQAWLEIWRSSSSFFDPGQNCFRASSLEPLA